VDISYGGESGFNEAIELATDALTDVKFIMEKKLIGSFFDEISRHTNKAIYGVQETLTALEMGAIEIIICWENLAIMRFEYTKIFKNRKLSNWPKKAKKIITVQWFILGHTFLNPIYRAGQNASFDNVLALGFSQY
jgi:peptide subunit release factor 1 (eRF1)